MSCLSVNLFDFTREKISSAKSNELTDQQDMFCFNHVSAFYTSNNIMKMLMNIEFKADNTTGNPTGNSCCHTLASRALNMSCSFGQLARSIESRCVVMEFNMILPSNPGPSMFQTHETNASPADAPGSLCFHIIQNHIVELTFVLNVIVWIEMEFLLIIRTDHN